MRMSVGSITGKWKGKLNEKPNEGTMVRQIFDRLIENAGYEVFLGDFNKVQLKVSLYNLRVHYDCNIVCSDKRKQLYVLCSMDDMDYLEKRF